MKTKLTFPVIIFALICFFSLNAYAGGWTDGWDVESCGIDSVSGMYLTITDGTKTYTFWADDSVDGFTNQALAVCLSAKASTEKIDILKFTAGGKFKKIRYHQ